MLITGFLLPGDSGLIACYLSDFFVVPLQSWSLRCYKWLVLNWRKYAIKNNSCNSSNDLMRLMEALQFNSVGSTGCEARLNTAASLIYQLIKCYLLSHPMNKYVVITVALSYSQSQHISYCEIEYNLPVTAFISTRVKVDKIAVFKFIPNTGFC